MEIKRDYYLNQLIDRQYNGLIKIVSGIRRCGKSYLLSNIFKDYLLSQGVDPSCIIQTELDDYKQKQYRNPDVYYEYVLSRIQDKSKMYYVFLDEVQFMSDFESVLNGLMRNPNLDIYVTGSNSRFLSSDVVTEFRGRGDEIRVFPLSFSEFFSALDKDWHRAWHEYMLYGGLPQVLSYNNETSKVKYLQNLMSETYIRDIVDRNKIQNTEELEELVNIVASNIGSFTNPSRLANTYNSKKKLDLSGPSIKQYLDYLQDAFIVNKVCRYDIKGKRYISTPYKYFFTDIGLRNSRLSFRQIEETHIIENIVFNELNIRGYSVDVGSVDVFDKSEVDSKYQRKSVEVDFVVNHMSHRYYVQVALDISNTSKKEQEVRSLLSIKDAFRKILIVKNNDTSYYDDNGILILSLKDFLLNPSSIDL